MPDIIELHNIRKTFVERTWQSVLRGNPPKRTEALRNITLSIMKGEIFGLLGPNGAGKSTLMKILATLILPENGTGNVFGYDLVRQSQQIRRIIGLVNMSERSFYWRLTGRQNLAFFAALHNMRGKQRADRIQTLLELVGLEEKSETQFMKYSSGQKQRLALARALLSDPDILLMDEPMQNLDPIASSAFLRMTVDVLKGKEGKTILWCTHNLREAEEICSRIAIIHRGAVIASGDIASMCSLINTENCYEFTIDHCHETTLKKMGIEPLRMCRHNGRLDFELKVGSNDIPSLMRLLVGNGVNVRSCRARTVNLDEIFEKIISHAH